MPSKSSAPRRLARLRRTAAGPGRLRLALLRLGFLLLAFAATPALAQPGTAVRDPAAPPVKVVRLVTASTGFGSPLAVQIEGLDRLGARSAGAADLTLRLDGHEFRALSKLYDPGTGAVVFKIRRSVEDRDDQQAWVDILGSPHGFDTPVAVAVGLRGQPDFVHDGPPLQVRFQVIDFWRFVVCSAVILLIGVLVCVLAVRTNILRDSIDTPDDKDPPYSLGRFQMAVWFLLIIAAFLFIWTITGDYNGVITQQSLILAGIAGAAGAGAGTIDAAKAASAAKAGAAPISEGSEGFLRDVLSDQNGVTIYRLQAVVWTLLLACVFLSSVYRTLSLPEFDENLLAFTGISSGVYVWFKLPEQPS